MNVLSGVVYIMKSTGPRAIPHKDESETVQKEDRILSHLTWKKMN